MNIPWRRKSTDAAILIAVGVGTALKGSNSIGFFIALLSSSPLLCGTSSAIKN
jgi:hypothetical protein